MSDRESTSGLNESQTRNCKCCGTQFTGSYCNVCGQKVIDRFSLRYLWSLLHDDLLEIDRGWWHTFKDLTLRPGPTIEGYLNGNTRKYFSPVKYLLLISGFIYLLLSFEQNLGKGSYPFTFESWKENILSNEIPAFSFQSLVEISNLFPFVMDGNIVLYFLSMLPFAALAGTMIFRSFNFTELLITWIYLWAHILHFTFFCVLIFMPLLMLNIESELGFVMLLVIFFLGMIYFITKTFRHLSRGKWLPTFFKVLLSMYGGFFTFFGLVWIMVGFAKVIHNS